MKTRTTVDQRRHLESMKRLREDRAAARRGAFHVEVVTASHCAVVILCHGTVESFPLSEAFR